MFVQQVVLPGSRHRSWTVLGPGGVPVEPVERYLAFLTDVDRSPNTVKAYAHDLKDWFVFLTDRAQVHDPDHRGVVSTQRTSVVYHGPPGRGQLVWDRPDSQIRPLWRQW